jgi:hypothetical protein
MKDAYIRVGGVPTNAVNPNTLMRVGAFSSPGEYFRTEFVITTISGQEYFRSWATIGLNEAWLDVLSPPVAGTYIFRANANDANGVVFRVIGEPWDDDPVLPLPPVVGPPNEDSGSLVTWIIIGGLGLVAIAQVISKGGKIYSSAKEKLK